MNHSKLKLGKGRAASALSPLSVTKKGTGTGWHRHRDGPAVSLGAGTVPIGTTQQ